MYMLTHTLVLYIENNQTRKASGNNMNLFTQNVHVWYRQEIRKYR